MSTIKSSNEHLTINADGSSKDIKFQANGVEKASISSAGAFTSTTIDATKLTGNLPAVNGSALTNLTAANLTGALPAISGASLTNLPASGISQTDQYRLHTNFTGDVNPVVNWERDDTSGFGKMGSGMSEDTGIFTFPATGIYKVEYVFTAQLNGDSRNIYGYILSTNDGSNYVNRAGLESFIQQTQSNNTLCNAYGSCFVAVTSTTNCKVKFSAYSVDTSRTMLGRSNYNSTYVTFIRIGDV